MNEQNRIREIFSVIHAPDEVLTEVMKMAEKNSVKTKTHHPRRVLLVAALLALLCALSAFTADYVVNHRQVFFFDTIEALTEAQREELPPSAANYAEVPATAEENRNMETVAEHVSYRMEYGLYGDEEVLFDETDDDPNTRWERRRMTRYIHRDHGGITTEYLTGSAYGDRLVIDGILDWDVSAATANMTPDEGGQIVMVSRKTEDESLVQANALLGYTTEEGKRFQIAYSYDINNYLQGKEYVLSSAYDDCYVYTAADGMEVLIKVYDGQIWVEAVNIEVGSAVYLYTTGCTTQEIEKIADKLNLVETLSGGR